MKKYVPCALQPTQIEIVGGLREYKPAEWQGETPQIVYLASDVRELANRVYPYVYEQYSGDRTPKETADLLDLLERLSLNGNEAL